jgi:DNA invertase Pin-like site-specific DNA recombinase
VQQIGQIWGYARVSTEDQELGLQITTALREAGVPEKHIVREKASGKTGSDRPLYAKLLEKLNDGDRLVVWKVDRLGRSTLDALQTAKALDARGVSIVITTLGIDLKTPSGRLVFGVMSQIAEFEHTLIRERVIAGMADAKARGKHVGRRHTLKPSQRAEAARLHLEEGKSLGAIADMFGCGRSIVFRAVKGASLPLAVFGPEKSGNGAADGAHSA